jgi:ubiquinone/menaquinone biosynthesis C-methylase UbiE
MRPIDNPRSAHFDAIADLWDGWDDLAALARRLAAGLAALRVGDDEAVVDLGCGTGNLTLALLAALGERGRVAAVDISPRMIQVAAGKVHDGRASFHVADAAELPLLDASCDRIICFSAWPHFPDKHAVARELLRVLRPGGRAHVWHLASRATINNIHANAGEAVRHDVLAPATDTAGCFEAAGFQVEQVVDDDEGYLVTGRRGTA